MAYFACGKAAKTGTDKQTRVSIAKGLVSPTFTDASGRKVARGVVQMDAVTGGNLGYVLGLTGGQRLASAQSYFQSKAARSRQSVRTPPATSQVQLYAGKDDSIKTTKSFGFPMKSIAIGFGIIAVVYLVVR